jgi:hypothetical protein
MRPKEKARQLVEIMSYESDSRYSKQCSLIVVDEMMNNACNIWGGIDTKTGLSARDTYRKYWEKVKQEIENYEL